MLSHFHHCSHSVLFYRDEGTLRESVSEYIAAALRAGAPVLVIAKPALRQQLTIELHRQHVQGAPFGPRRGEFLALDAESTLDSLCVQGRPDAALFRQVVGGSLARLHAAGQRIAAYGEMVGLLCERGQYADAVRLEALWNELLAGSNASLYCGYPASLFDLPSAAGFHDQIRTAHRDVYAESAGSIGSIRRQLATAAVD